MVPALVLLPGMDGTGDLFAPLVAALGPRIRTIIVRYPDKPLDYAAHEDIARAALPVGDPFILVGESFSGLIAISIAASAPMGLRGYVLCCSFVRSPRRLLGWLRPLLGLVPPQRFPAAIVAYFLLGRFGSAELLQLHAETLGRVSPSALIARLTTITHVDVSSTLRRVTLPALYLRATEDRLVPGTASRLFARLASNARIVDIEGPHLLLQARPDAAAEAILDFAGQLGDC
jgi:pimeloyl-[acyl-carrier protein] methyl ester esterase